MFTPSSPVEQPVDQSGNYSSASVCQTTSLTQKLIKNVQEADGEHKLLSAGCAGGSCGSEPIILEKLINSLVPLGPVWHVQGGFYRRLVMLCQRMRLLGALVHC